ncbi:MAG: hypothetical protein ACRD3B_10115 [Candidatus Sulfotelmatobacter sp.]
MSTTRTVLPFPKASGFGERSAFRKNLLNALRVSESPVIVDLTGRCTLNHGDVDLVLECVAQAAGRDAQVIFAAGCQEIRILLEVIRVSSLARVANGLEEALDGPQDASSAIAEECRPGMFELPRSA